jgi:hypothetical protein
MKRKPSAAFASFEADKRAAEDAAKQAIAETRRLDRLTLAALVKRLDGRRPRPLAVRLQRWHKPVYRDPRDVVFRFLRRYRKGEWYRGGSHVARLFSGPGIGFRGFRNDRRQKIKPLFLDR